MNCREKSHFCCGKFYGWAQSNVQPKCFSYSCAKTIPEVVNFFFRRGEGAGGISLHEFVSKRLVSKQTGIKMTGFPVTKY